MMTLLTFLLLHNNFLVEADALATKPVTRRDVVAVTKTAIGFSLGWSLSPRTASSAPVKDIAGRFAIDDLTLPPPSLASELNGVDNLYYPKFLEGEWDVIQTLVDAQTPLGLKYAGGPNGNLDIATKSMNDTRSKIGVPVELRLRWVPTKWGVAEDRLFNTQSRLDAFAGRSVVASVQYADVGGSNRQSVLALGGTKDDPLQVR
jgi:hypothetical protein